MIYLPKLLYVRVLMGWTQKTLIKKSKWSLRNVSLAERKSGMELRGFILNIIPPFKQLVIMLNFPPEILSAKNTEIFIGFENLEDFYFTVSNNRKELRQLGFELENNIPRVNENQFFSEQKILELEEKFSLNLRARVSTK